MGHSFIAGGRLMCGLAGIVHTAQSSQAVDEQLLRRMTDALKHRGPDGEGFFMSPQAGLGHRRLSIIDVQGGAQPMASSDGTLHVVYNGEIYNFAAVEEMLRARGHTFRTRCDTEVILEAYRAYGPSCVELFRGMFSFALWDAPAQTLFFARDRLGKKPLLYGEIPGGLAFASEFSALLRHPSVGRETDLRALDLYLTYQYIPSPRTAYHGIHKLPPAHYALWTNGKLSIHRYWSLPYTPKWTESIEEASATMMERLRESVRLRLMSDVPLGAFLSGGLDSATIVSLMAELSSRPVKTFSIGFEESDYSELSEARALATQFGCDHHEFVVKPNAVEALPELAAHYGEPFADPSALATYYVARETRREVTVALSGDGGDETLAGYYRYAAMMFLQRWSLLPLSARRAIAETAAPLRENPARRGWARVIREIVRAGAEDSDAARYLRFVEMSSAAQRSKLYNASMKSAVAGAAPERYLSDALTAATQDAGRTIDRYLATDLHTYLPECLMVKTDIASMAHSLEVRCPFLDHEFVEYAARLPDDWKWHPLLQTKWILRRALRERLPEGVRRQKKKGFEIPVAEWLRGPLKGFMESALFSPSSISREWFDQMALRRLVDAHASGRENHFHLLWGLLMLELWRRSSRSLSA